MDRPDVDEIRARHWPLDMRDMDLSETAAEMIAELVRYLNHASGSGTDASLPYASVLYRISGQLSSAMHGMQQLLQQLSNRVADLGLRDDIRHDSYRREAIAVSISEARRMLLVAGHEFTDASRLAPEMANKIDRAQQALATISHDVPEENES